MSLSGRGKERLVSKRGLRNEGKRGALINDGRKSNEKGTVFYSDEKEKGTETLCMTLMRERKGRMLKEWR